MSERPPITCSSGGQGQRSFLEGLRLLGFTDVAPQDLPQHLETGDPVLVHGWLSRYEPMARAHPGKVHVLWHSGWSGSDVMGEGWSLSEVLRLHAEGVVRLLWLDVRDTPPPGAARVTPVWDPRAIQALCPTPQERLPGAVMAGFHGDYPSAAKNITAGVWGALAAGAKVHTCVTSLTAGYRGDVIRALLPGHAWVSHPVGTRQDVARLLASMELLVHASLSDTWPWMPMESVYLGTPVVISDVIAWHHHLPPWVAAACVVRPATSVREIQQVVRMLLDSETLRGDVAREQRAVLDDLHAIHVPQAVQEWRALGFAAVEPPAPPIPATP